LTSSRSLQAGARGEGSSFVAAERPLGRIYEETRLRVAALVSDAGVEGACLEVPACPSWTVHGVVAHLVALYGDIVSGNLDGAGSDDWTNRQVRSRQGTPILDVLGEWADVSPKLTAMIDDFPGLYGRQVVADLAVHEQDIRGALRSPGARHSPAVAVSMDFVFAGIVGPGAVALGLGPVTFASASKQWTVGGNGPASEDPDAAIAAAIAGAGTATFARDAPAVTVTADGFDLFRALTGRRSSKQVRCFDWSADPTRYLPLFGLWPFTVRETDLLE
jgi:hypothetical protein